MTSTEAEAASRGAKGAARAFWEELPREGRILLSTVAIQHLGRGMTLPFTIVYLHEVRGFSLQVAGLLLGLIAAVSFVLSAPGGALVDSWGARRVLIGAAVVQSLAALCFAGAVSLPVALLACVLAGASGSVGWPASSSLIASIVDGRLRQHYFGVSFALLNLGIGLGGAIAGLVVDVARPATFVAVFLVNAVLVLIPAALLLGPLRHVHGRAAQPEGGTDGGYREVLRLPGMAWLILATALMSLIGYGQLESGVPAFARTVSSLSTGAIGAAYAVNTAAIVLLQMAVLRRVEHLRRTRVLLLMLAVWALAWVLLGLSGWWPGTPGAVAAVLAFKGVFGVGETLLQSALPALTNDLAPAHLRGRVNAASSAAFSAGAFLGPVLAGGLLDRRLAAGYIGVMLALLLVGVGVVRRVERGVPPEANRTATD